MMTQKDRLFVPLTTEAFEDFRSHGKLVEIRKINHNFSRKTVYRGRDVELRHGYSGKSMWGTIGKIAHGDLAQVIHAFPLATVEPRSSSYEAAIEENEQMLGEALLYIGFQVLLLGDNKKGTEK